MSPFQPRPGWLIAAGSIVILGLATLLAWRLWPHPDQIQFAREETACLLTDDRGLASADASLIWTGMQQAATTTGIRIQYLAVHGPQTPTRATEYLTGLIQTRCGLIIAPAGLPADAIRRTAPSYPTQTFIIATTGTDTANITHIHAATQPVRDLIIAQYR